MYRLNPFESGSVFKRFSLRSGIALSSLNPFESGSVFKQNVILESEVNYEVLIPLNQGLFLNTTYILMRKKELS